MNNRCLPLALVLVAACVAESPDIATEDVVGSYLLTAVGASCDVEQKTGGSFQASKVGGRMVFGGDGRVTHSFDIGGVCVFPDGTREDVSGVAEHPGTYLLGGASRIELDHSGAKCTATYNDGLISVRTAALFPPVRFTYTLTKQASTGQ